MRGSNCSTMRSAPQQSYPRDHGGCRRRQMRGVRRKCRCCVSMSVVPYGHKPNRTVAVQRCTCVGRHRHRQGAGERKCACTTTMAQLQHCDTPWQHACSPFSLAPGGHTDAMPQPVAADRASVPLLQYAVTLTLTRSGQAALPLLHTHQAVNQAQHRRRLVLHG
jgi:hypothetical protein